MAKKPSYIRAPRRVAKLDPKGRELPSSVPMAPPIGFNRQPSLSDRIREMVKSEKLAQEMANEGKETFEEADDFDVDDEFDPQTPYEEVFEPDPVDNYSDPGLQALHKLLDERLPPQSDASEVPPALPRQREVPEGDDNAPNPPPSGRRFFSRQ